MFSGEFLMSGNKRSFTSQELLYHLVDKVIPHEKKLFLLTEAPITDPTLPTLQNLGTISRLTLDKDQMTMDDSYQIKMDRKDELKRRKDIGEIDLWSLPPKIDKMKYLTIELTFEYPGVDGAKCLD